MARRIKERLVSILAASWGANRLAPRIASFTWAALRPFLKEA
jgi:hypothetical protein